LRHLTEDQFLCQSHPHSCSNRFLATSHSRWGFHHFLIEAGDTYGSSWFNSNLNIRNANRHLAKLRTWSVAAKMIPPRAGHGNVAFLNRPREGGASKSGFDSFQARP